MGSGTEHPVTVEEIIGYKWIKDGRMTVTTAGARQQLSTVSVPCKLVIMVPLTTNTGVMAVGGTTVVATATQQRGIPLVSGDPPFAIPIDNLNKLYLDATIAANVVTYITLG